MSKLSTSRLSLPGFTRYAAWLGMLLLWATGSVWANEQTALCVAPDCGIPAAQPYPHLVVGTIQAVGTPADTAQLFQRLRASRWAGLPEDADAFSKQVQPISIRLDSGRVMTLLMTTQEMRNAPLPVGAFVRFAPHRNFERVDAQPNNPYWVAVGCIAQLCAPGDKACTKDYPSGIYRITDGRELDEAGQSLRPHGQTIDVWSMRPVAPEKRSSDS